MSTINGNTTINGTLTVSNDMTANKDLHVRGWLYAANVADIYKVRLPTPRTLTLVGLLHHAKTDGWPE